MPFSPLQSSNSSILATLSADEVEKLLPIMDAMYEEEERGAKQYDTHRYVPHSPSPNPSHLGRPQLPPFAHSDFLTHLAPNVSSLPGVNDVDRLLSFPDRSSTARTEETRHPHQLSHLYQQDPSQFEPQHAFDHREHDGQHNPPIFNQQVRQQRYGVQQQEEKQEQQGGRVDEDYGRSHTPSQGDLNHRQQHQYQEEEARPVELNPYRPQTPPTSTSSSRVLPSLYKSLSSPIPQAHSDGVEVARIGGRNRLTRRVGTKAAFAPHRPPSFTNVNDMGTGADPDHTRNQDDLQTDSHQPNKQEQQRKPSRYGQNIKTRKANQKLDVHSLVNEDDHDEGDDRQEARRQRQTTKRDIREVDQAYDEVQQGRATKRTSSATRVEEALENQEEAVEPEEDVDPFNPMAEVAIYDWKDQLVEPWTMLQKENVEFIKTFSENMLRQTVDVIYCVNGIFHQMAVDHAEMMEKKVDGVIEQEKQQKHAREMFLAFRDAMSAASLNLKAFAKKE